MKKQLIATIVAAMLSASAMAGNEILVNEYIKAGVNEAKGIDSIKIDSHPIDCFVL